MMRVGIIGTAGRKEDAPKMTAQLYTRMCEKAAKTINEFATGDDPVHLVSGGAAWADHVAVTIFLDQRLVSCSGLTLYLPATFDRVSARFVGADFKSPGAVANYYHRLFSAKLGRDTGKEISDAITRGATVVDTFNGFFARNLAVGNVDYLLAFTWGSGGSPKPGGTKHTWDNSSAKEKLHISLANLCG